MVEKNKFERTPKELLKESKELVARWRRILRLTDWIVIIKISSLPDDDVAAITPDFVYKRATVYIDPIWTKYETIGGTNLEHAIIHEMLHIRLGETKFLANLFLTHDKKLTNEREELLRIVEERTVEIMARVIQALIGGD